MPCVLATLPLRHQELFTLDSELKVKFSKSGESGVFNLDQEKSSLFGLGIFDPFWILLPRSDISGRAASVKLRLTGATG